MQVQVNVKAAAKRVKKFIEAAGGSTTHSEVLELMSEVCGFDSYRALQAASSPVAVKAPAALEQQGRPLETADSVVFSATAVDWQFAGNPKISLTEVPQERRSPYDFIVEQDGSQFRVLMKPVGVNLDNFEGKPVLDMLIEVNDGLPCVHMTNDPADAMLATVFATGQGLLIREDGGDWMRGWDAGPRALLNLADKLTEMYKDADVRNEQLNQMHLVALDTAEKYRDDPVVSSPQSDEMLPTPSVRILPHVRKDFAYPVRRQHVWSSYVEVSFEPSETFKDKLTAKVSLFDTDGVCRGDIDTVRFLTRLSESSFDVQLKTFATDVAALAAVLVPQGYEIGDLSKAYGDRGFKY